MPAPRAPMRRSHPARALAAGWLAAVALAVTLAGCSQINSSLSRQWAVVSLKPGTSVATLLAVRRACSDVPGFHPAWAAEPREYSGIYALRYRANRPSRSELAAFRTCLSRFTAVSAVSFKDLASTY